MPIIVVVPPKGRRRLMGAPSTRGLPQVVVASPRPIPLQVIIVSMVVVVVIIMPLRLLCGKASGCLLVILLSLAPLAADTLALAIASRLQ